MSRIYYPHYRTPHSYRPFSWQQDYNSPCLPPRDYPDYLEQALINIWRNDEGYTWLEIYWQLLGIKRQLETTAPKRAADLDLCQLIALYRNAQEQT